MTGDLKTTVDPAIRQGLLTAAKAECAAHGDSWNREGRQGLFPAYAPTAAAAIAAFLRAPGVWKALAEDGTEAVAAAVEAAAIGR